jgi:gliding motility-associated-like protein
MKLRTPLLISCLLLLNGLYAQRAKNGNYTVTSTSVLNAYTTVTSDIPAGSSVVPVASNTLTNSVMTAGLVAGDLIMIVQMQGATMDIDEYAVDNWGGEYTTATNHVLDWYNYRDLWGGVLNYNNCGKYELAEVRSVSGTNSITLQCGLKNAYTSAGHVQVVRVPRFNNLTVNANVSVNPALWDGSVGGIVALEVDGILTLQPNGKISASGFGFRGAALGPSGGNATSPTTTGYVGSFNSIHGAPKGEGIGGFTAEYTALSSVYCVGAPANAGGGGNNHNGGGGGGSNVGTGTYTGKGNPVAGYNTAWNLESAGFAASSSAGGGRGGYTYSTSNQDANVTGPANNAWSGDFRRVEGGFGGHNLAYDADRVFMGGGGGAGHQNNNQAGAGSRGGGIVALFVYGSVSGSGIIESNGAAGQNSNPNNQAAGFSKVGNDGAGGAGGGGAIVISHAGTIPSTVTLNAQGGAGGNQNLLVSAFASQEADGPGGGGGGGMIAFTSGTPAQSVAGGLGGTTNASHLSEFPPNGATGGAAGISSLPKPFFDLTVNNPATCSGNSVTLTATVVGTMPAGAQINWYSSYTAATPMAGGSNTSSFTTPVLSATTTYYVGICGSGTFRKPVTVTVGGPSISGTASITNVTCSTAGSITGLTTSGGVAPVTIAWNSVVTPTMDLTNASAGTYDVLVTDAAGCTATAGPYTISSTGGPSVNTTNMIVTSQNCLGSNGSITGITTTGSIVSVSWNSGAYSTLDITGLSAGNYSLVVTDNLGCTASAGPVTVGMIAGPSINSAAAAITNETCGNGNGSITGITASGNSLTFEWNGNPSADEDVSGLSAGSYTLVAEDNLGCTASAGPFTVTNSAGPALSANNIVVTSEHCNQADGSISGITVSGGQTPYIISWSPGGLSTLDITDLSAGSYNLTVSDANGCTAASGPHIVTNVSGPAINTANVSIEAESCVGNDGAITGITASGTGLSYQWNFGAASTADLTGQPGGTYALVVTDQFGCQAFAGPYTIPGATPLSLNTSNVTIISTACTSNTGSISGITINGGINPQVQWSNNATTLNISGLAADNYAITVTDDQGCTVTDNFTVNQQSSPVLNMAGAVTNPEHCGQSDGSITGITVSGGVPAYSYSWDGQAVPNAIDISEVEAGNHTLTVTDAGGCTDSETIAVASAAGPSVDVSSIDVENETCSSGNGSIQGVNVAGSGPFTYEWSNTATSAAIFALSEGSYTLTVTDAFGCEETSSAITITNSGDIFADFSYSPQTPQLGETVVFSDNSTGSAADSWNWSVDTTATAGIFSTLQYAFQSENSYSITLTVESAEGCIDSITKVVSVFGDLTIPNVITRNNDGANDVFYISNLKPGSELSILNRWGSVVFVTADYKNDWKGESLSGEELTEGVYTYQLINAEGKLWQGFVHLIID